MFLLKKALMLFAFLVTVTNKRNPIAKNYTIHGKTLELVKNAKFLGLNISHNLS
jgi:hypothetical protein